MNRKGAKAQSKNQKNSLVSFFLASRLLRNSFPIKPRTLRHLPPAFGVFYGRFHLPFKHSENVLILFYKNLQKRFINIFFLSANF